MKKVRDGVLVVGWGATGNLSFFSVFWGRGGSDVIWDFWCSFRFFVCTFLGLKDLRLSFVPDYSMYILICSCCLSCFSAFRYHLFRRAAL